MGFDSREKVYVDVTATTHADGSIEPRFLRWPDGRLFPIAAAEGGPTPDYFEPGVKPAKVSGLPYSFRVFIGNSKVVRRLYLEMSRDAAKAPPRWYVQACDGDIPYEPPTPHVPPL